MGFKILAITFVLLLAIAGATIMYANRPRSINRGELQALINTKVCHGMECPVPDGDAWFKVTPSGKSITIHATLEVPRAALNLHVPKAYPKPEGKVEINLEGVLVADPEFKLLPTPPGEDGDYLRVRPTTKIRELIKSEWDTASVSTVRTDIAIFTESLEIPEQTAGRELALQLALSKGTNDELKDDLQALNPQLEEEFKQLAAMMHKESDSTKDPARKKIIAPKMAEFDKINKKIAENKANPGRRGGGGGR
jgi:hypothetical protein